MTVAYVVKRYPRYSETFIVTEILAHERAGLPLEIVSLRPPIDTHFQDSIARVRAPVTYLAHDGVRAADFWLACEQARALLPELWPALDRARGEDARDVYQALLLAAHVRCRGITHLHAHFGSLPTTVARLAAAFAGISYTFTAHAKDIFHQEVRPEDLRRKLVDASGVVTVSDYNLRHLRESYGAAAAGVRRVYNGLDLEEFRYSSPELRPARIVAVGRLVEKKGFEDLIAACAILAARGRRFGCEIIGAGPGESELRALVRDHDLEGTVEFLGPQPRAEVIRHVQGAAALAAPCVEGADGNRDGLPTVLLEAMALGTPCVSTDVTGIPEVLRDGDTGVQVPQRDPAALADGLERLLADPTLRVRLAAAARALMEAEFDIHRNAAALRALFESHARRALEVA